MLGGDEADGTDVQLGREDRGIDGALEAVYGEKRGGLGASAPTVARWLGELRANFPAGVVRVVQQDAIDRLGLHRLLLEPEVLDSVTPDVHLAATLMSLRDALPEGEPPRSRAGSSGRSSRTSSEGSPTARAAPPAARSTAAPARRARGRPRSTGTARSGPTCATTSRSTGR